MPAIARCHTAATSRTRSAVAPSSASVRITPGAFIHDVTARSDSRACTGHEHQVDTLTSNAAGSGSTAGSGSATGTPSSCAGRPHERAHDGSVTPSQGRHFDAPTDLDVPSNGLCLCKLHHWAFDNRLITIRWDEESNAYRVTVTETAEVALANEFESLAALRQVEGLIPDTRLPFNPAERPNRQYLETLYEMVRPDLTS